MVLEAHYLLRDFMLYHNQVQGHAEHSQGREEVLGHASSIRNFAWSCCHSLDHDLFLKAEPPSLKA